MLWYKQDPIEYHKGRHMLWGKEEPSQWIQNYTVHVNLPNFKYATAHMVQYNPALQPNRVNSGSQNNLTVGRKNAWLFVIELIGIQVVTTQRTRTMNIPFCLH